MFKGWHIQQVFKESMICFSEKKKNTSIYSKNNKDYY